MENKRKANIFENYTCQQVNMARNTALQIMNAHLDRSRCWQHLQEAIKKTVSFTVQSWQKQMKLCVFTRKGELFKLSTFSFQSLMLKFTKKLKLRFAMFENTVKIQLLCIYILFTATCSRMNSLVNQTDRFFHGFLSDSVEITSCAYTKTIIHLRLS